MRDRLHDAFIALLLVVLAATGWLIAELLHTMSGQIDKQEKAISEIRAILGARGEEQAALLAKFNAIIEDNRTIKTGLWDMQNRLTMIEASTGASRRGGRESP